jgi:hypothetical protein
MHISHTEASKLSEANCNIRLSEVTSKRCDWVVDNAANPVWVTVTPLGVPVEPEV